ncbi:manganese efflux pump [Piscibacillus salipiscarius]|uniref:manganese efflux pump n=1 Tax=Piscibacillus salipiscarius TaxID=299480 RepID=UPI00243665F4|nr:manganese efflux pump [Piscibacillus salipiscarius]
MSRKKKFRKYYHDESIRFNFKTIWMILKDPQVADLDHSGTISGKESLFVALALSLDSFSSGVGAAFTILPYFITAVLIGFSSMFLGLGTITGRILTKYHWMQQLSFLPGLIFIMLGIWNITK